MIIIIILALSVFITVKIVKAMYANTIGTTGAYILRGWLIWIFVLLALIVVFGMIGLI